MGVEPLPSPGRLARAQGRSVAGVARLSFAAFASWRPGDQLLNPRCKLLRRRGPAQSLRLMRGSAQSLRLMRGPAQSLRLMRGPAQSLRLLRPIHAAAMEGVQRRGAGNEKVAKVLASLRVHCAFALKGFPVRRVRASRACMSCRDGRRRALATNRGDNCRHALSRQELIWHLPARSG